MNPETSIAGFYPLAGSPRTAESFNVGWRFTKGPAQGAEAPGFDDSAWPVVSVPHGLEILPLEASGGVNYQGEAWYRKRFDVQPQLEGKRVVLHFEGLMGKSKFWVNGKLLKEHFGGYLPCILDISDAVDYGKENVISVWVDNSDDTEYPPGKSQSTLDFSYFGGIYRDVWLITTDKLHVTDPNETDIIAGGGVFVHFDSVSEESATVSVETHIANGTDSERSLAVETTLLDGGRQLASEEAALPIPGSDASTVKQTIRIENPHLWHPDDPYMHDLIIRVTDGDAVIDAVRLRIGIRSIEFRGREGFFLNGKLFDGKLIGTNRHQDHAYVGNALSNGAHWRDAVRLRKAGMRVIRCAHYPQDPSFMDACDALGLFVIITTPGWQFWNEAPVFEERVFCDIRNMVRRDRNRPSAWLWEPILNETNYPDYFAKRVHEITHEEYPHPGCYTACDLSAEGQEFFDVVYSHIYQCDQLAEKTSENAEERSFDYSREKRCVFTREWGDCVMDWRAQSSASRAAKGWGERAQLVQAKHYADPDYLYTCLESLYAAPPQHVGGTLWHGVDHYRGYHADAFWGGMLDATRQPKFSYDMFRSQMEPGQNLPYIKTEPFVYIAHILHPNSEPDVTVYSNCEEVRLSYNGEVVGCKSTRPDGKHMPHYPVVFEGAFKVQRHGMQGTSLEAEGLIGGKVAARSTRRAWDRRHTIELSADTCGIPLQADGGDFISVAARIVDKAGEVIRLTDDTIRFSVTGPAELIGGETADINPQKLSWGEAVILVRAGTETATITVRAESLHPGVCKPLAAEITFESIAAGRALVFKEAPALGSAQEALSDEALDLAQLRATVAQLSAEITEMKANEVGQQQEDFI